MPARLTTSPSVLGEGKVVAEEARGRVLTVLPNVVVVAVTVLQKHLGAGNHRKWIQLLCIAIVI